MHKKLELIDNNALFVTTCFNAYCLIKVMLPCIVFSDSLSLNLYLNIKKFSKYTYFI